MSRLLVIAGSCLFLALAYFISSSSSLEEHEMPNWAELNEEETLKWLAKDTEPIRSPFDHEFLRDPKGPHAERVREKRKKKKKNKKNKKKSHRIKEEEEGKKEKVEKEKKDKGIGLRDLVSGGGFGQLGELNLPAVANDCNFDVDCQGKYRVEGAVCMASACLSPDGIKLSGLRKLKGSLRRSNSGSLNRPERIQRYKQSLK